MSGSAAMIGTCPIFHVMSCVSLVGRDGAYDAVLWVVSPPVEVKAPARFEIRTVGGLSRSKSGLHEREGVGGRQASKMPRTATCSQFLPCSPWC